MSCGPICGGGASGIQVSSAARDAGIAVKINMVALRGINDDEIAAMLEWCGREGHDLTLIETMPMGDTGRDASGRYLDLQTVRRRLAERFELYVDGIELANGFTELADADEQRRRFEADNRARQAQGLPPVPLDEGLLAALRHGLPDCAGVALGFDRLLMLACGFDDIAALRV